MSGTIVIGAGQTGASLVARLRALGYPDRITLIGEETVLPYQRPPLSKAYLLGQMGKERLLLRPESFYRENDIDLCLGTRIDTIDRANHKVVIGQKTLRYDNLVLATGAVPRRLPDRIGGGLRGVYVLRTLQDVDAMAHEVSPGRRVLVVGGGYVGLEVAAVAAGRGLKVTLVEMSERILQRVACRETSDYFRQLHTAKGVDIREGIGLETLTGTGRVSGAELSCGARIAVDFVIVGIGIAPAVTLAQATGLEIDNGIETDEHGRTSDPRIWAAGDCASFPHRGTRIRQESVANAIDMAECVAGNIMGARAPFVPRPWFWSEQYDVKLQIAGLNTGYDRVVRRPGKHNDSVSFWYYRRADLLAVDAMNDPRAYLVGKRLIDAGKSPGVRRVADANADLSALLRA